MTSNIKNIIIVVVVVVAIVLGYLFFFNKTPDTANLNSSATSVVGTDTTTVDVTGGAGTDFMTTLSNVKNIMMNTSLLSDPAFATLHDSSIELTPDGTEGRPNPFAPIGVDIGTVPTKTTTPSTSLIVPTINNGTSTTSTKTPTPKITTPVKPIN